jgi:hypothetical protein
MIGLRSIKSVGLALWALWITHTGFVRGAGPSTVAMPYTSAKGVRLIDTLEVTTMPNKRQDLYRYSTRQFMRDDRGLLTGFSLELMQFLQWCHRNNIKVGLGQGKKYTVKGFIRYHQWKWTNND